MPHPALGSFISHYEDQDMPGPNWCYHYQNGKQQILTRVAGGHRRDGAHWQFARVSYENQVPNTRQQIGTILKEYGGKIFAEPTDWTAHPVLDGQNTYYFWGFYHQNGDWHKSHHVHLTVDRHQNGFNIMVTFDIDSYLIESSLFVF